MSETPAEVPSAEPAEDYPTEGDTADEVVRPEDNDDDLEDAEG